MYTNLNFEPRLVRGRRQGRRTVFRVLTRKYLVKPKGRYKHGTSQKHNRKQEHQTRG
jgi:hypothetical protein